jgi:hypothetical protein
VSLDAADFHLTPTGARCNPGHTRTFDDYAVAHVDVEHVDTPLGPLTG